MFTIRNLVSKKEFIIYTAKQVFAASARRCRHFGKTVYQSMDSLLTEAVLCEEQTNSNDYEPEDYFCMLQEFLLKDLMSVSGVVASSIYSCSGEVLLSKTMYDDSYETISSVGKRAVDIYNKAYELSQALKTGTPAFISFETANYTFIYYTIISEGYAIGSLMKKNGNCGLAKFEMLKIGKELCPHSREECAVGCNDQQPAI